MCAHHGQVGHDTEGAEVDGGHPPIVHLHRRQHTQNPTGSRNAVHQTHQEGQQALLEQLASGRTWT